MVIKIRSSYRNLPILEDKMKRIHYVILSRINQSNAYNLKGLSKSLGKAQSTVSYHLHRLQNSGYLRILSDGFNSFYQLTEKGFSYLGSVSDNFEIVDRAHDILFKFPIMRKPKDGFLEDGFYSNKTLPESAKQLTKKQPNRVIIQINPKSITINISEVRGRNLETCIFTAFKTAESEIIELIEKNPGLVIGTEVSGITHFAQIRRQSHAIPMDPFAVTCSEFGVSFKDKKIEVDRSHGIPEIEFTDPKMGGLHLQRYKDFVDAIISGKIDIYQIIEDFELLKKRCLDDKNV